MINPQSAPQNPSFSISPPKKPEPANDNRPVVKPAPETQAKAVNDNRSTSLRTGLFLRRAIQNAKFHPWIKTFYLLEKLEEHSQKRFAQLQAKQQKPQIEKQQVPQKEEAQHPASSQARPLPNKAYGNLQRTQNETASRTRTRRRNCFEKEDFRPPTPKQILPKDDFLKTLAERGNTEEQEARLIAIYEQIESPQNSHDVKAVYRNTMNRIAQHEGRETMDRSQDAHSALLNDQRVFAEMVLNRHIDYQAARDAIASASPSTANLPEKERDTYVERVVTPALEMSKLLETSHVRDQGRGSDTVSEIQAFFTTLSTENLPQSNARDEALFIAEYSDLYNHRFPGEPLDAGNEYARQLGEHIRAHGRQNLSFNQKECKENEYTADQKIAAQMSIAGHVDKDIKQAIIKASPAVAEQDSASKSLYVSEEIEPVFSDPATVLLKKDFDEWRSKNNIPQSIKRFDCLQKLLIEAPDLPLQQDEIKAICPDRPSLNPERGMEPELDW